MNSHIQQQVQERTRAAEELSQEAHQGGHAQCDMASCGQDSCNHRDTSSDDPSDPSNDQTHKRGSTASSSISASTTRGLTKASDINNGVQKSPCNQRRPTHDVLVREINRLRRERGEDALPVCSDSDEHTDKIDENVESHRPLPSQLAQHSSTQPMTPVRRTKKALRLKLAPLGQQPGRNRQRVNPSRANALITGTPPTAVPQQQAMFAGPSQDSLWVQMIKEELCTSTREQHAKFLREARGMTSGEQRRRLAIANRSNALMEVHFGPLPPWSPERFLQDESTPRDSRPDPVLPHSE